MIRPEGGEGGGEIVAVGPQSKLQTTPQLHRPIPCNPSPNRVVLRFVQGLPPKPEMISNGTESITTA
ncbi:MAG: hypothetical protein Ct9H90mP16_14640 [Candidatus Poseidoniales archaeon]|nr:MAG: hypothetical protein Ct9H90mP16_14640 [Candidatus Poseidoniales archaeon]